MTMITRSIQSVSRSGFGSTTRLLSSTAVRNKTVTESAKDTLDSVNKSVGKGLASAIDTGEKAAKKTKEAVVGGKEKAGEAAESVHQRANVGAADARQTKDELLEKGKSS